MEVLERYRDSYTESELAQSPRLEPDRAWYQEEQGSERQIRKSDTGVYPAPYPEI